MLEHALRYAIELKWPIIPVGKDKRPLTIHGSKDATCDERTIRDWFTNPKTYVGIGLATGKVSGIAVLDIDLSKESCAESVEILKSHFNFTPSAVRSKTGSGGEHHFYAIPEGVSVKNAVLLHGLQGIDVRGNGGYVVVPPSENMSGVYEWMPGCSPFDVALPPVPDFMRAPKTVISISTKVQAGANGGRNNFLTREAGRMRAAGMEYAELLEALRRKNRTECAPPLQDDEVRKIAESISKYPPAPNTTPPSSDGGDNDQHSTILNFPATDMGRAELIRYMYAGHIKYNVRSGVFYLWDTPRWRPDNTGEINTLVVHVSRQLQRSAATISDETARKAVLAKAKRLESADGITSALKLFKTLSNVATLPEEWDSDVNLLGVANGVVDLRTGQMLDPDPERLISLNTNVSYNPTAPCHRWEQFLLEVTDNDETLVNYLQKAVGYSLTGHTSEQCFFLLVGAGANGKSVFMNTLMEVFGDYGIVTPFSTFERTAVPNPQSNDIAALDGKRFVVSSETTISSVFNEARLKQLTGDEQVSARFLHKEYFTFKPKLKLWLSVNHPPKVRDDSHGFWRVSVPRRALRGHAPQKEVQIVPLPLAFQCPEGR